MIPKDQITVASAQFDIKLFDKSYNLKKMMELSQKAKHELAADLIVFPECSVTGYCMESLAEVKAAAEPLSGNAVSQMLQAANDLDISIIFGMLEADGDKCYNTAVLCEPGGYTASYRKTHLPFIGADRFVDCGNHIGVIPSRFGPIGIMICYDLRFPEVSRQMALLGARILLQPTNLSDGGEAHAEILTKARACENRIYLVSCNRIGMERGSHFIGRSQIVNFNGAVLAELGDEDGMISAVLDLRNSDDKDIIVIPGEYETRLFTDRQPELYDILVQAINPAPVQQQQY